MQSDDGQEPELQRSLRQRHMTMISLGGVIGAGLFVGSGAVMNQTGPAAVLSYIAAGTLIVLMMRILVLCVVPWNDAKLGSSPFIAALDRIGIPGSADIMNGSSSRPFCRA
jgi:L-asparagine transporter-like permease